MTNHKKINLFFCFFQITIFFSLSLFFNSSVYSKQCESLDERLSILVKSTTEDSKREAFHLASQLNSEKGVFKDLKELNGGNIRNLLRKTGAPTKNFSQYPAYTTKIKNKNGKEIEAILQVDLQHNGEIEVYDFSGKHMGAINFITDNEAGYIWKKEAEQNRSFFKQR